jgi:hypothetical protein
MRATLTEGNLIILPENYTEVQMLVTFAKETDHSKMADRVILNLASTFLTAERAKDPANPPATPPAVNPDRPPQDAERRELLKRCEELGIELKKGQRNSTLKKLIQEAEEDESKNEEPEEEATPAPSTPQDTTSDDPVMLTPENVKKLCGTHINVFGEESFRSVLSAFAAEKFSDLLPKQYQKFVEALTAEGKKQRGEEEDDLLS